MPHDNFDRPNEEIMKSLMQEAAKRMNLGATGNFPDGKINEKDEGEIRFAITVYEGRVVINFGKPVSSIGFTAQEAKQIGEMLIDRARQVD